MAERRASLEERVVRVAEAALAERSVVIPIDVLVGLGWLTPQAVDAWRQGRADDLERLAQANPHKLSAAMAVLLRWAAERGLRPSETAYVARTRDRRALRFSRSGDAAFGAAYRTHWISSELSAAEQRRLTERQSAAPDIVVFSALGAWTCTACGQTGDLLIMEGPGPLCLACADLDHLVFLATGDGALTRRAKKASALSAVVVRFSRSRRRYERQGTLVEEEALVQAERACLADEDARHRRRLREEARRSEHDAEFQAAFAQAITELVPGCPTERADAIARHSGRVGRSAAARALDPEAATLAVVASVRDVDTPYDRLLMSGVSRADARRQVADQVSGVIDSWRFAIVR